MARTADSTLVGAHREAATSFLQMVARGDVRRAFDTYVAPNFRHHNPHFRGDARSLARAMQENADQNPEKTLEVRHVIEEGDFVATYSRVRHRRDGPEAAVAHFFRFEGDRVAELWDIGQEMPKNSPNEHGMF